MLCWKPIIPGKQQQQQHWVGPSQLGSQLFVPTAKEGPSSRPRYYTSKTLLETFCEFMGSFGNPVRPDREKLRSKSATFSTVRSWFERSRFGYIQFRIGNRPVRVHIVCWSAQVVFPPPSSLSSLSLSLSLSRAGHAKQHPW